ncbi:MAG TPA: serine hydrolase domain-containing protein [Gemmatimonadaceae bacterium]|jgi:CubicO group peptidase (beta-lactamase class C family)
MRSFQPFVAGLVLTASLATRVSAQGPSPTPVPSVAAVPSIDSIFAAYDHPDVPGASVIVIRNGAVVLSRAYGMANLEDRVPATERTSYRLASVTKQFTATAILLLVHDGKLHLDDHVIDVLPGFPAYAKAVTIRQLLTHTGGLWAYEDFVPDTQSVQAHDHDIPRLIGRVDSTYFTPGAKYRYSNTGYVVLGLVVEAVSHQPFATFLRDRIFKPLGMDSTVAYQAGISTVPQRAYGYSKVKGGTAYHRTDQSSTSATLGDGGIYTSTHDMVLWNRALDEHLLIDADMQKLAWTPQRLNDGSISNYGFGWNVGDSPLGRHIWHTGETRGFRNAILKYPDRGLTVIVLTNRSESDPLPLAERVAAMPAFSSP